MQNRVALVLAGLSLAISILAMSSVGGASNARLDNKPAPVAFALVDSDANCSGGCFLRNSGFDGVSYVGDGHYCLTLSGKGGTSGRVATVAPEEEASSTPEEPQAIWDSTNDDCPAGTFQVSTNDQDTDTESNEIAFTIVVH